MKTNPSLKVTEQIEEKEVIKVFGSLIEAIEIFKLFPDTHLEDYIYMVMCVYSKIENKSGSFIETEINVIEVDKFADYILNKDITLELIDSETMLKLLKSKLN